MTFLAKGVGVSKGLSLVERQGIDGDYELINILLNVFLISCQLWKEVVVVLSAALMHDVCSPSACAIQVSKETERIAQVRIKSIII